MLPRTMVDERPITILALASEFKGIPFLEECKRQGCRVLLVTNTAHKDLPWPRASIDEFFDMRDIRAQPDLLHGVSYLARDRRIDRIMALDDYDVEHAADLREHMRLRGMGHSDARLFRDKLAMRTHARKLGIPVPEFVGIFNYDEIRGFMARVAPPWVFKPRMAAGSEGIRKLHDPEELWRLLHALGDQRSYYLLERFIPGQVFHVDSLSWKGEVVFSLASGYGAPPMATLQGRKVFTTRVLPRDGADAVALRALGRRLVTAMGLVQGPSHSEFIKGEDGQLYFLETAARVAGGHIDKAIEAATGVVMWQETARMEIADVRGADYALPELRHDYGGLLACPWRTPFADTAAYDDPELVHRVPTREFLFLVLGSPDQARVEGLLERYAARVRQDFM